jgi:hypothetical protein
MPPRDHSIPSLHRSPEADHLLEAAFILCVPPLRLCLISRTDSEPMSNIVERTPGTDFSKMQCISPALAFPDAPNTISELPLQQRW